VAVSEVPLDVTPAVVARVELPEVVNTVVVCPAEVLCTAVVPVVLGTAVVLWTALASVVTTVGATDVDDPKVVIWAVVPTDAELVVPAVVEAAAVVKVPAVVIEASDGDKVALVVDTPAVVGAAVVL
jgi:hypothetical protein